MEAGIAAGLTISTLSAAIGALVAYLVARRRESGTTNTSQARDLWKAHGRLLEQLEARVVRLEQEISAKDEIIRLLRTENSKLEIRIEGLEGRIEHMALEISGRQESSAPNE